MTLHPPLPTCVPWEPPEGTVCPWVLAQETGPEMSQGPGWTVESLPGNLTLGIREAGPA